MTNRIVISVDFDGTITRASEPEQDGFNQIRPGCKESMQALHDLGVDFVLLTARSKKYLPEAKALCRAWNLPIDLSHPNSVVKSDFYINDKGLDSQGVSHINWYEIYRQIRKIAEI